MTEPKTIYDSINIEYEPELLSLIFLFRKCVISDISFPQMQSIFATISSNDFIPPVQKSPHLCARIDDQRSLFKGVLSSLSFSTTQTYAQNSDKSATKLAFINKTTSSDFFDEPSRPPNGPHTSNNLYSLALNIGTSARMHSDPDTFRGGR
jgi:hypothetical protein